MTTDKSGGLRASTLGHQNARTAEREGPALPVSLEKTVQLARGYFEAARAENTVSAYDSDLREFT